MNIVERKTISCSRISPVKLPINLFDLQLMVVSVRRPNERIRKTPKIHSLPHAHKHYMIKHKNYTSLNHSSYRGAGHWSWTSVPSKLRNYQGAMASKLNPGYSIIIKPSITQMLDKILNNSSTRRRLSHRYDFTLVSRNRFSITKKVDRTFLRSRQIWLT